jgi:Segregation and condensation complex subunit ScpB
LSEQGGASGNLQRTTATIEVLACIAFRQPISQAEIDRLFEADKRGLVVKLRDLKLVEEFAGADGRLRFATTEAFLQRFGLASLQELTATWPTKNIRVTGGKVERNRGSMRWSRRRSSPPDPPFQGAMHPSPLKRRMHQLIHKRSRVARAAAVATAVYQNGTIATPAQRWNLITPIATMAEAAMQQDHGRAGPVPDPSTVAFDVALIICDRQQRGAIRFKPAEVVVVSFHFDLLGS